MNKILQKKAIIFFKFPFGWCFMKSQLLKYMCLLFCAQFAHAMHKILMNLHPLHVQFMQQTKHNAKSVWHEAPTKQQFKEFYGAFCFGSIERKKEKVQAERQHLGGLLRSRAKKILPSDGRRWISFSNNPMPTCIDTQSATKLLRHCTQIG